MTQYTKNPNENFGQFNDHEDTLSETSNTSSTNYTTSPSLTPSTPPLKNKNQLEGPSSAVKNNTCDKDITTPSPKSLKLQSTKSSTNNPKNNDFKPAGILKYKGAIPPAPAQIYHGVNKNIHLHDL